MKKPLNQHAKKVFYRVFAIAFSTALLNHTLLSFYQSLCFLLFVLLAYAYLLGMFKRKKQQSIDLQQAIEQTKNASLNSYTFEMRAVNPYLVIYGILIPFLWLGWYFIFSTFVPLLYGTPFHELSLISWLGLVLFALFVFICFSAATHSHKNDAPFVEVYQVVLTPTHITRKYCMARCEKCF